MHGLVAVEADRVDRASRSALTDSFAIVRGVRATRNSRRDAAAVTASLVCADSIVAIRTWNGSSCCSFGDLLDRRLVEPVDRLGETAHDGGNPAARHDGLWRQRHRSPGMSADRRQRRLAVRARRARSAPPAPPSPCGSRASRCRGAARARRSRVSRSAGWTVGLPLVHVERGAGDQVLASSAHASASSSTTGPRAVFTRNADRFIRASARSIDQVPVRRRQRRVNRDDVRGDEQLVERNLGTIRCAGAPGREHGLHPERRRLGGDRPADASAADDPELLAAQLHAEHEVERPALPRVRAHQPIALGDAPRRSRGSAPTSAPRPPRSARQACWSRRCRGRARPPRRCCRSRRRCSRRPSESRAASSTLAVDRDRSGGRSSACLSASRSISSSSRHRRRRRRTDRRRDPASSMRQARRRESGG